MASEVHPLEQSSRTVSPSSTAPWARPSARYGMREADIRGTRFADAKKDLLSNGDLFSSTQPQMICDIHRRFLEPARTSSRPTRSARRASVRASSSSTTLVSTAAGRSGVLPGHHRDPAPPEPRLEINERSARQCREWADRVAKPGRAASASWPGAIGPLTVSLSNSPDADDAGFRVVTFDQVKTAYIEQVRALIAGGPMCSSSRPSSIRSMRRPRSWPSRRSTRGRQGPASVMVSAAVGRGGETMISAQTVEALWERGQARQAALDRPQLLARPDLMSRSSPSSRRRRETAISCYPTRAYAATLPDGLRPRPGGHGPLPRRGCPGRTRQHRRQLLRKHPEHIAAIAKALDGRHPRELAPKQKSEKKETSTPLPLRLSAVAVPRAARRLHDDRRAHERRWFTEVREADRGGRTKSREHRSPAGRKWRPASWLNIP